MSVPILRALARDAQGPDDSNWERFDTALVRVQEAAQELRSASSKRRSFWDEFRPVRSPGH